MKNQALFSLKHNSKKLKCCLRQFLFGALRINESLYCHEKKRQVCTAMKKKGKAVLP